MSIRLGEIGLGAAVLSLQHLQLPCRGDERALRRSQRGLTLALLRRVLLRRLHGAPTILREVRVTRRPVLRERQTRLLLLNLGRVLRYLCLLHADLRVDVRDACLRGIDLRLRLSECGAVVAVVDPCDHLTGLDMLVVGDRNCGDVTRDFRRDRELARRDESVVGGFEMARVVPVEVAASQDRREQQHPEHQRQPTPRPGLAWSIRLPPRMRRRRGWLARLRRNIPRPRTADVALVGHGPTLCVPLRQLAQRDRFRLRASSACNIGRLRSFVRCHTI